MYKQNTTREQYPKRSWDRSNCKKSLAIIEGKHWKPSFPDGIKFHLEDGMLYIRTGDISECFTTGFIFSQTTIPIGRTLTDTLVRRILEILIQKAIFPYPVEELI